MTAARTITFTLNGAPVTADVKPHHNLVEMLQTQFGLIGARETCGQGLCGCCTVIVNGRAVSGCLYLAVFIDGADVVTIESLDTRDHLSPVQEAFIEASAFQCGYCTPGQICSAVALVGELKAGSLSAVSFADAPAAHSSRPLAPAISDDEIRERMSGNLCRCGAYSNIVAAVRSVAEGGNA